MKVLVNFSDDNFAQAQLRNTRTGVSVAKFDHVCAYRQNDIDPEFYAKNERILSQRRGAGYWLWKPYFVSRTLDRMSDGDYLFYCDAGAEFIDSITPLIDLCEQGDQDIMVFELAHIEKHWTKRDAFVLMDCDFCEYADSPQRLASFFMVRKSVFTCKFMKLYLHYAQDERVITDIENQMGYANHDGFIAHRHDQSILSLLSKKFGLAAHRDPSQWGNEVRGLYPQSRYAQLINHTRSRNGRGFLARLVETIGMARMRVVPK